MDKITNNNTPTVSVIIPTYNRIGFIVSAIKSVRSQTYDNIIELIIVDDASNDGTFELIKSNFLDIVVIRNEKNMGACFSRNIGSKFARGEYIAFLDSDDMLYSKKIEKQIHAMQVGNFKISTCASKCPNGYIYCGKELAPNTVHSALKYRNCLGGCTAIVIEKKTFLQYKFDENMVAAQDWDLFFRLSKDYSIKHLSQPLYEYTLSSNDRITNNPSARYRGHRQLFKKNLDKYYTSRATFFFLLKFLSREAALKHSIYTTIPKVIYLIMIKILYIFEKKC